MSTTESASHFNNLEHMHVHEILVNINKEDKTVPDAVEKAIPQIEALVNATVQRLENGGRLFYIGAGTSGRLGIVDASECPPTYGVPHGLVVGIIAGGDGAIRKAVEFAEDDFEQAWKDLAEHQITNQDIVVGIAASGRTPYVIGGLEKCREQGIATGCIVCNAGSRVAQVAEFPVEIVTGPEFVTGSTRMKAGTAQKLALNMLTTATMIRLGRVKGNKMVDMQLSNHKLVNRAVLMVMDELPVSQEEAEKLVAQYGSVREVIKQYQK
ncbi:N-acetylmuramic acid 6-phosphate etherase [Adhaeribacter aquaticus]|uniref:N-acetylmuramic acid 6-phosphate etherase n=1 Tax=Adhaeribacter aquaticus TaxID=299567 RepID=UPI000420814C|nr:N-acetylmuramic acid 6-phosphate etherase [Adhaeribacter aquaticus]